MRSDLAKNSVSESYKRAENGSSTVLSSREDLD